MDTPPVQKPVFATHAQAEQHVQEIKNKHLEKKEAVQRDMRETIGEAVEREIYDASDKGTSNAYTIQWKPGQYEQIFSKKRQA